MDEESDDFLNDDPFTEGIEPLKSKSVFAMSSSDGRIADTDEKNSRGRSKFSLDNQQHSNNYVQNEIGLKRFRDDTFDEFNPSTTTTASSSTTQFNAKQAIESITRDIKVAEKKKQKMEQLVSEQLENNKQGAPDDLKKLVDIADASDPIDFILPPQIFIEFYNSTILAKSSTLASQSLSLQYRASPRDPIKFAKFIKVFQASFAKKDTSPFVCLLHCTNDIKAPGDLVPSVCDWLINNIAMNTNSLKAAFEAHRILQISLQRNKESQPSASNDGWKLSPQHLNEVFTFLFSGVGEGNGNASHSTDENSQKFPNFNLELMIKVLPAIFLPNDDRFIDTSNYTLMSSVIKDIIYRLCFFSLDKLAVTFLTSIEKSIDALVGTLSVEDVMDLAAILVNAIPSISNSLNGKFSLELLSTTIANKILRLIPSASKNGMLLQESFSLFCLSSLMIKDSKLLDDPKSITALEFNSYKQMLKKYIETVHRQVNKMKSEMNSELKGTVKNIKQAEVKLEEIYALWTSQLPILHKIMQIQFEKLDNFEKKRAARELNSLFASINKAYQHGNIGPAILRNRYFSQISFEAND